MTARIPRRWSFRIDACTGCGSARLEWITTRIEVPYADRSGRAGTASATTPMSRCRDCGAESLPAESMWHGHAAVCRAKGLLAPQDIVDRRRALGLTQEELSELTGLGIASIRRWEAGTGTQNVANDRALRWAFGEPPPRAKSADGIRARKR